MGRLGWKSGLWYIELEISRSFNLIEFQLADYIRRTTVVHILKSWYLRLNA